MLVKHQILRKTTVRSVNTRYRSERIPSAEAPLTLMARAPFITFIERAVLV